MLIWPNRKEYSNNNNNNKKFIIPYEMGKNFMAFGNRVYDWKAEN